MIRNNRHYGKPVLHDRTYESREWSSKTSEERVQTMIPSSRGSYQTLISIIYKKTNNVTVKHAQYNATATITL